MFIVKESASRDYPNGAPIFIKGARFAGRIDRTCGYIWAPLQG
jgi:hypothetical protein